uniref:condensation domain-containing protein n=1 Tax=Streptacidiphilus carbonis TaxID=105422 RepID=UPI00126A7A4E
LRALPSGQVGFNYLGRFSTADMPENLRGLGFTEAADAAGLLPELDADLPAMATVDVSAFVVESGAGAGLDAVFRFPSGVLSREEVQELADLWCAALEGLARHVAGPGAGGLTPSDLPLVPVRQHDIDLWEKRYPGLADVWPLTPLQSGLLFHAMLAESEFDAYHMQLVLHLSGSVDPGRMRAAGQALLDRHAALRTAFVADGAGELVQVVPGRVELPWRHDDLAGLGVEERDAAYARLLAEDHAAHFDPAVPPLLRMSLVTMGPDRSELVLTAHHVLVDGWSLPVLMADLLRLYGTAGDPASLPDRRGFRDFLVWLSEQDREESARAWARELEGVEGPTLLAPEAGSAADQAGAVGAVDVPLPPEEARELSRRAAELGVTLNTVVQGAWALLLSGLTGSGDVVFGATVSGRPPAVPGVDEMVGLFINTLPVRVRCAPSATLADLLTDLQQRQGALLDHHYYGLTDIHRDAGLSTLFDTLVGFESYPVDRAALGEAHEAAGIGITGVTPDSGTHYPLSVVATADPHLRVALQYQEQVFDQEAAGSLAARFVRVLRQIAADPYVRVRAVDLLEPGERVRLLDDFNETGAPVPVGTIPGLFEARVAATPDATAVVFGETTLTYRELDDRANGLARVLAGRGVRPESVVGVALTGSPELVVALLAVMKAGGAYLPINPDYPAERLEFMLRDAGPALVVTDAERAAVLPPAPCPLLLLDDPDTAAAVAAAVGAADLPDPGTRRVDQT